MKTIPLTKGQFAIVDDADYAELSKYKWCANESDRRYTARRNTPVKGKNQVIVMHRQIMGCVKSDGKCVDHINHNTLDNRRSNLRLCTSSQNSHNMSIRGGTSIFKGVSWFPATKKWRAGIMVDRKAIHLGYYDSETKAAKAYNEAAIKYHHEFACVNIVKLC